MPTLMERPPEEFVSEPDQSTERTLDDKERLQKDWEAYVDHILWPETSRAIAEFQLEWDHLVQGIETKSLTAVEVQTITKNIEAIDASYVDRLKQPTQVSDGSTATKGQDFLIEDMARHLRHEFRNFLTPILGYLKYLKDNLDDEQTNQYFAGRSLEYWLTKYQIDQQLWRGQLGLELTKEDQKTELHLKEVAKKGKRGDQLDEELWHVFRGEAGIDSETKLELMLGETQENNFEQIVLPREKYLLAYLRELIRNSLYYLKDRPDGRIRLTFDRENRDQTHGYRIQLEDNGPGIPEENVEKILAGGYSEKGGTGNGISVGARLIQVLCGAQLVSIDRGSDGGARFTIWVPDADQGPVNTQALRVDQPDIRQAA